MSNLDTRIDLVEWEQRVKPYSEYKDSGQAWLGRIPAHWTTLRSKLLYREVDERSQTGGETLCSVSHKTGVTPRKANVTMFMSESTVGYKICRPDDLVINTLWAWMAALGIAREVGVVSPAYGIYRPRPDSPLNPRYADSLLRTEQYKQEYIARSTGVNASRLRLYPEQFLRMLILLPPPDEQTAIVRFLAALDRRVNRFLRAKRRLIDLLTEQKQAIITHAVTRGLDPNVKLKPSGIDWLGDVPEHWEVCRLRNVVSGVTSGSRGWSSFAADEGPLFIRIANLRRGSLNLRYDDVVRLNLPKTAEASRTRISPGDLLLSITAFIGSIAVAPADLGEAYVSQHVARCPLRNDRHNPRWLGYVLLSDVGQTHGRMSLYGGTKDGLSLDDVKNYPLLLPPRPEQDAIVDHLQCALASTEQASATAEREIALIREYRTRLVADVVTGKLDVRAAASRLPEEDGGPSELAGAMGDPSEDDIAESDDTAEPVAVGEED